MRMIRAAAALGLAVACLAAAQTPAQAVVGGPDPSFGANGIVLTAGTDSTPTDLLVQPDGKIVVVTDFRNTPNATIEFGLLRYNRNGALDTSFGSAGRASTAFTNFISYANDAVLQPDGKLVVVGEARGSSGTLSEFAVARFNPDGSLDASFGTGGQVTTNFVGAMPGGVSNPATTVLLQADGKILVGGSASKCPRNCGPRQTALARYNANGSLDTRFGTGGTVAVVAIGQVSALAEDASGNIFALDGAQIAQFNAAGALQPRVTPAPVTIGSAAGFRVTPAVFQADGRYAIATGAADGTTGYRHDTDATVVRYHQTGAVDPSFTNPPFDFAGEAPNATDLAQGIAEQANGQIVLAGYSSSNGNTTFNVARLTTSGALDPTFGTGGTLTLNVPGGQGSAVVVQPDGKILVAGSSFTNGSGTLVLARFLAQ